MYLHQQIWKQALMKFLTKHGCSLLIFLKQMMMKVHFKISDFIKHCIMVMTVLAISFRQLIIFLRNVRHLLMATPAPPLPVNHQPQVPQPAEPLPPHQPPPPQPLRRSQRIRRAPQRLTL